MNYKEIIERKIEEERSKALWGEIATAYEQGGEQGIKFVLVKKADEIVNKSQNLLKQLREKL